MATVQNVGPHILDLTSGHVLAPQAYAEDINIAAQHEEWLIESGLLLVVDGAPPVDPTPMPQALDVDRADEAPAGSVIYKGADDLWHYLAPGPAGTILHSLGGAVPQWTAINLADLGFDPATQSEMEAAFAVARGEYRLIASDLTEVIVTAEPDGLGNYTLDVSAA